MKKFSLNDFEQWKQLNQHTYFSLFDYIFHVIKKEKLSSDLIFAFFELFWPSFFMHEGFVFLKSNFSIERVQEFKKEKINIEYWINLFLVDPYFDNEENSEEKAEWLSRSLVNIWRTKLIQDFPHKRFVIEYVYDAEHGDYGLTFFQEENKVDL